MTIQFETINVRLKLGGNGPLNNYLKCQMFVRPLSAKRDSAVAIKPEMAAQNRRSLFAILDSSELKDKPANETKTE